MRIFNKTNIFYIFFSLLLLCLGVSCILISPNNKKSNAEWMYAEARIINLYSDYIPLASNSTYLGQTIYSVSPTLSVSAGTTSGSWCTATATGSSTTATDDASATQWNSSEKGWVKYSFNEIYLKNSFLYTNYRMKLLLEIHLVQTLQYVLKFWLILAL